MNRRLIDLIVATLASGPALFSRIENEVGGGSEVGGALRRTQMIGLVVCLGTVSDARLGGWWSDSFASPHQHHVRHDGRIYQLASQRKPAGWSAPTDTRRVGRPRNCVLRYAINDYLGRWAGTSREIIDHKNLQPSNARTVLKRMLDEGSIKIIEQQTGRRGVVYALPDGPFKRKAEGRRQKAEDPEAVAAPRRIGRGYAGWGGWASSLGLQAIL